MMPPFSDVMQTKDGDPEIVALANRHYSRKNPGHSKFVGPGQCIVLRNPAGTWGFAWRKCKYRLDDQTGWECSFFRNESKELSSAIILKCELFVTGRMFTMVNPKKVKSTNPGYCFQMAGWKKAGVSKGGLVILEKYR
jgi:hypothetical protein